MQKVHGSFRDPSGAVFKYQNKIIRSISKIGEKKYIYIKNKNIIEDSIKNNFLIDTFEINDVFLKEKLKSSFLLEHKKLQYISYPYEWCFEQLKDAAIHHLNFQLFLLERGFELIDASAYNIQFIGSKPIFIDCLSLNKYKEGNPWLGHNQFCEQFLNPLLFTLSTKVLFNNWYKGSLEGIKSNEVVKFLKLSLKFNPIVFLNIILPNIFHKFSKRKHFSELVLKKNKSIKKNFSKKSYFWLIKSLKKFIHNIKKPSTTTFWGRYSEEKTYSDENYKEKKEIVKNFIIKNKLKKIVDIGCNNGDFSELCLMSGSDYVVGLDYDEISLEKSYLKSRVKKLNFLPLYFDASNPSSNIGWYQKERDGFLERCEFDGLIALAFEHHLTIAKNISFEEFIKWLLDIAPIGLIEFVPKNDKTIRVMLDLKGDIFPDYTEENFKKILRKFSNIVRISEVGNSGRKIYEYRKYK